MLKNATTVEMLQRQKGSEKHAEWDYVGKASKTDGDRIDETWTAKSAKRLKAVDQRVRRRQFSPTGDNQFRPQIVVWGGGQPVSGRFET